MSGKDIGLAIISLFLGVALGFGGFFGIKYLNSRGEVPPESEQQESQTVPEEPDEPETIVPEEPDPIESEAARIVSEMTLEEKVAQLFVVYPEQITFVSVQTLAGEATRNALTEYPVGGIIFFARNLESRDQTTTMLANMQTYSHEICGLPIFLCVDEEGGTVVRIADNAAFGVQDVGNASDIGATGDAESARAAGAAIGTYLGELGFNVDFAPDADVANNPASTMTLRSFSPDATVASEMVGAFVKGMAETGVLSCAKHFPGIGGVIGDSETGVITSEETVDEMAQEELLPFQAAVDSGVRFVMVGHLTCPGISDSGLPASLDPAVISILRDQLGYDGIIITDALSMGAVVDIYPASEIGVQALLAGDDMILMPADFEACYQGILDAVADGTLSEERIDESVTRIVETKLALEG